MMAPTSTTEGSAGDLALACAAASGDPDAISLVDRRYIIRLGSRLRRMGLERDEISDVLQTVRERLFTGGRPRISTFDARVPLGQWIKVIAIRAAIDRHRGEARLQRAGSRDTVAPVMPDPSTEIVRRRYKNELEQALRDEIDALPDRDRAVLRLHFFDGMSIEAIAAERGLHRVTVARWIWKSTDTILDGLRRRFRDQHGLRPSECDSLARALTSQVSLGQAWRAD